LAVLLAWIGGGDRDANAMPFRKNARQRKHVEYEIYRFAGRERNGVFREASVIRQTQVGIRSRSESA